MGRYTAVFDSCVLYPAPLRDLLISVAETGVCRARWTDRIHDEWISSLLENRPDLNVSQLQITRQKMDIAILDCLVTGYEPLIDSLILPDPNDRHVLAAAIVARADAIVTFNLRHFPADRLSPFGIEALHPDEFVVAQIGLDRAKVCSAVKRQRQRLRNPPKTVDEFLDCLARQELPQTVNELARYAELL